MTNTLILQDLCCYGSPPLGRTNDFQLPILLNPGIGAALPAEGGDVAGSLVAPTSHSRVAERRPKHPETADFTERPPQAFAIDQVM
jgi:hypothetical protein